MFKATAYVFSGSFNMIASSPSKNNVQQVFQKFHVLLKEEFSPEDIHIIACPTMEQVIHSLKILFTFITSYFTWIIYLSNYVLVLILEIVQYSDVQTLSNFWRWF